MLGLSPLKKLSKELPIRENPVEDSARGLPLKDIEVRCPCPGADNQGWIRDIDMKENVSNMVKKMDECGVSMSVGSGISSFQSLCRPIPNREIMLKHQGRFKGYLVFNPLYKDRLPLLDDYFQRGFFIGFKILGLLENSMDDKRYILSGICGQKEDAL